MRKVINCIDFKDGKTFYVRVIVNKKTFYIDRFLSYDEWVRLPRSKRSCFSYSSHKTVFLSSGKQCLDLV